MAALYHQGLLFEAAEKAREALELAEQLFGPNDFHFVQSLDNMALLNFAQGRYVEELLNGRYADKHGRNNSRFALQKRALQRFAERKYGRAELLFKKALAIKGKTFRPNHPELIKSLGGLAEVHKARGKYSEAYSLLHTIRSNKHCNSSVHIVHCSGTDEPAGTPFPRRDIRFKGRFPAELVKAGSSSTVTGKMENLSRDGGFIKTESWQSFAANDHVEVTIVVPSSFSDTDRTVRLQGSAKVVRVDEKVRGLGLKFTRSLRQSGDDDELELAGNIRYKPLVHYLATVETDKNSLEDFKKNYPYGLLIEKSESILDKGAIFQFSTLQIDDEEDQNHLPPEHVEPQDDILEKRVIEIRKRNPGSAPSTITVGRAADNDIVLYHRLTSRHHAILHWAASENKIYLADLASRNGTFLNRQRLSRDSRYELSPGDQLSFGPEPTLVYLTPEAFYDLIVMLAANYGG